jgi:hypothetical protein
MANMRTTVAAAHPILRFMFLSLQGFVDRSFAGRIACR